MPRFFDLGGDDDIINLDSITHITRSSGTKNRHTTIYLVNGKTTTINEGSPQEEALMLLLSATSVESVVSEIPTTYTLRKSKTCD